MEFKHTRLDNGLDVIAEVNPDAASLAAGFFVRTGSRDETPEVSGVSHFLEHMVFKGTERRTALDVNREFDEMGANYNASTSEENTVFYGAVLPEHQPRLLDLLCDILRPSLRAEDFEVEKQVILDEIALYEDDPHFRVYDQLMACHFDGHPMGNMILGTSESISALGVEQMRGYFQQRYAPNNLTVAATGDVDFHALVDQVANQCGPWESRDADRGRPAWSGSAKRVDLRDDDLQRANIGMMSAGPAADDPRRHAAHVLTALLGSPSGSRLFYALVDPALADEASMYYHPMDGTGGLTTFVSCDPPNAERAMSVVRDEFRRFVDQGPRPDELAAAKNKIATVMTLRGEVPMGRFSSIGRGWVYRREYLPLAEEIETLLAVRGEEVAALAREFDLERMTAVVLSPGTRP